MSTLHRLSIRNVRSYADEQLIKFSHPLTIIVGANGCGKTTIIECLRYICSGEFPPLSDKGKSFVHDPDRCGEAIVKGQIKLSFKTGSGKNIIAIKSFQVTAQKGRRTFKLIDSVIATTNADGTVQTAGYKCARMDELMTHLIGVSQPILDNVIFCHQLDADWPLSDDKALKKRFDDIFSATKYTRALESIKKFRTEQLAKTKDLQRDLDILSNNLETAQKHTSDLAQTSKKLEAVNVKWELAKEQKAIQTERVQRLSMELSKISSVDNRLTTLKHDAMAIKHEAEYAHSQLTHTFIEPDEELQSRLEKFQSLLQKRRSKLQADEQQLHEATVNEEALSTQYKSAVKAVGRIEVLQEQHQEKMTLFRESTLNLSREYKLNADLASSNVCLSHSSGPQQTDPFIASLDGARRDRGRQLSAHKLEAQTALGNVQREMNALQQQLSELVQTQQIEERQIALSNNQFSHLDVEATISQRRIQQLQPLRQQFAGAEQQLMAHDKRVKEMRTDVQMEGIQRRLAAITSNIATLDAELRSLQTGNDARNVCAVKEKLRDQAQEHINEIRFRAKPAVERVLGVVDLSVPGHVSALLESARGCVEPLLQSSAQAARDAQQHMSQLNGQRHGIQQQLTLAESRIAELKKLTGNIKSLQQVDEGLIKFKTEKERHEKKIRESEQYVHIFAEFGQDALRAEKENEAHSCGLCDRPFVDNQLHDFITRNKQRVDMFRDPAEMQSSKSTIEKLSQRVTILENHRVTFAEIQRITATEVPRFRNDLAAITSRIEQSSIECEQFAMQAETARAESAAVAEAIRAFAPMQQQLLELQKYTQELQEARRAAEAGMRPGRTPDIVRADYDALLNDQSAINKQIDDLRATILKNDQQSRTLTDRLSSLREQMFELNQLEAKLDEIEKDKASLKERMIQAEELAVQSKLQQEPLKAQLQELKTAFSTQSSEFGATKEAMEASLQRLEWQAREFTQLFEDVGRIGAELATQRRMQESASALEHQANAAREHVREMQSGLNNLRESISQLDTDQRGLQDNIQYRLRMNKLTAQTALVEEMTREKEKLRRMSDVTVELSSAKEMLNKSERDAASCEGSHCALKDQVLNCKSVLNEERYKNIGEKHRHVMIDLETTRMSTADLDMYYRALDRSLMDFHSIKMREINAALKELWQATYRGNDIDSIAIRSDHAEGAAELGAGRQKKQYSYRLVMVQGDTELDMRGRSSAGQRVLASLLIRMALAETFCSSCGILALDEPSQNLDKANIAALADALNNLINRRKAQNTFQLILITHDEAFVEMLRQRDHVDYYWRVFKDASGYSRIKKVDANA